MGRSAWRAKLHSSTIVTTLLLVATVVLFLAHAAYFWPFTADDAFISFRYAANLANGQGLVFNLNERVQGYTNFLLILLEALFLRYNLPGIVTVKLLGVVCGVAVLGVTYTLGSFLHRATDWTKWLAVLLLAANGGFVLGATNGLETMLFTLLILVASYWHLVNGSSLHCVLASIAFGLATLTRPEGALFFTLAVFDVVVTQIRSKWSPQRLLLVILPYVLIVLPFAVWQWKYYGNLVPNTFYAKAPATLRSDELGNGVAYVMWFFGRYGLLGFLLFLFIAWFKGEKRRQISYLLLVLVVYIAYVIVVGGDWVPFDRFLVPVMPILFLLIQMGVQTLRGMLQGVQSVSRLARIGNTMLTIIVAAVICRTGLASLGMHSHTDTRARGYQVAHLALAEWLTDNTPQEAVVAIMDVGIVGHYSGRRILDTAGLVSREVALMMHHGESPRAIADHVLSQAPDYIVLVSKTDVEKEPFDTLWTRDMALHSAPSFQSEYHYLFQLKHMDDYYLVVYARNEG